jgi:hypothetical protein
MRTTTPTLSPAAANRALIARWRHYRLDGPDAVPPRATGPCDELAAEALRKIRFADDGDQLTEYGISAVLDQVQPLLEFVLLEREIVGFNVLVVPRAFMPMLGIPVSPIATVWWYVQQALQGRNMGRWKARWRGFARAFLGHPVVRAKSLRVLERLPDVPMRRAVPDPAQSNGAGCFFHFPASYGSPARPGSPANGGAGGGNTRPRPPRLVTPRRTSSRLCRQTDSRAVITRYLETRTCRSASRAPPPLSPPRGSGTPRRRSSRP